jgi:ribonuclease T1
MGLRQIRVVSKSSSWALAALLAVSSGALLVQARTPGDASTQPGSSMASVALTGLPQQAQEVMVRIREGGSFQYERDGTVFGNRERLLPSQTRGFYREYTVPTPGLNHRGARRIVCGGQQPRQPDACFYTADHYSSFRLIVQ